MLGAVELEDGTRRARVVEGWITWVTREGKQNLRVVHERLGAAYSAEFLGSSVKSPPKRVGVKTPPTSMSESAEMGANLRSRSWF